MKPTSWGKKLIIQSLKGNTNKEPKKKPAPRNKPCSLLLHEVRSLFNEVSSLTKEWPPHRPRRQPSPAVSYLIPFQESKADR